MKTILSALLTGACVSLGLVPAAAAPRPNIVVILADDQGWGDLSVNGNTNLRTPNIDSLARDGARFDRFFVCSVCAPTRAEFFTGRYHSRGGVRGVSTGQERLNTDEKTIADFFRAAGYATGAFGKWHNGSQWPYHPNARGFEEFYGFTSGHWSDYFDPPLEHNGRPVRGKGFITDDLTSRAIEFIERHQARPFFCYLPLNTPHSPFQVPDEFYNRFKDRELALRARNAKAEDLAVTRAALAMCENIDWNVGRLLKKLDELRLADNTIVVYFSDNGPNSERWNGGMKGRKGSVDEGGLRVPCLMRWPGRIRPGTTISMVAGAIDLLPTLATLADVPLAGGKPLDGRNLQPLLRGGRVDWGDRRLFSLQNGRVSVRTQQYRLDPQGALFDLVNDPGQATNIAAKLPEMANQLAQAVTKWRAEVLPPARDDRPFPVGYAEFPVTPLPARDGVPRGGVKRSAGAPNCSYFTNWRALDDRITWDTEVATAGMYEAEILYTCPTNAIGATIELAFNGAKWTGTVTDAFDPPFYPDHDRVPRKGESYMKEFRPMNLGRARLEKGRGELTLRALKITGPMVMEVRGLRLTLVK